MTIIRGGALAKMNANDTTTGKTMFDMLLEAVTARRDGRMEDYADTVGRICDALDRDVPSVTPTGMVSLPALCRPGDTLWCANPQHSPLRTRQYEVVSVEVGTDETLYHCREVVGTPSLGLHLGSDEFRRMMFASRADAEQALAPALEEHARYEEYLRQLREEEGQGDPDDGR